MIDTNLFLSFVLAVTLLMLVPGPNVALIVANSVAHGPRYGLLTVAGTTSAMVVQLGLTALGMTATLSVLGGVVCMAALDRRRLSDLLGRQALAGAGRRSDRDARRTEVVYGNFPASAAGVSDQSEDPLVLWCVLSAVRPNGPTRRVTNRPSLRHLSGRSDIGRWNVGAWRRPYEKRSGVARSIAEQSDWRRLDRGGYRTRVCPKQMKSIWIGRFEPIVANQTSDRTVCDEWPKLAPVGSRGYGRGRPRNGHWRIDLTAPNQGVPNALTSNRS